MSAFDWDAAYRQRREELSRVPTRERAARLLAALKGAGFLEKHELGVQDDIYRFSVEKMEKWGAVEPYVVLGHAGEAVSPEIEGDYYEEGSYARELERFLRVTQGEIEGVKVRDKIDLATETVSVSFEWNGEAIHMQSRAPEPITDYFDTGIVRELNKVLEVRRLTRRFVECFDVECQGLSWVYVEPAGKPELEAKHLLIFSEKIPYSAEALPFLW